MRKKQSCRRLFVIRSGTELTSRSCVNSRISSRRPGRDTSFWCSSMLHRLGRLFELRPSLSTLTRFSRQLCTMSRAWLRDLTIAHKVILLIEAAPEIITSQKPFIQGPSGWIGLSCSTTNWHAYKVVVSGIQLWSVRMNGAVSSRDEKCRG